MIKISGITKSFGNQTLFENLSFGVNRRERIGLVGRNGHGKTTLFKMILGEINADDGEIIIPRRYRIGHLDQHLRHRESTALGEACLGLPEDRAGEAWKAEKILFGLGFKEEDLLRDPAIFSGGFQVRLNLARVLVSEPDLLLLDEPTNYLDIVSIRWLARFLRTWPSELMLITHDRSFMDSVVTHTVAIHRRRGKKTEGNTSKLYAQILKEEEIHEKTRLNEDKKRKDTERFIERFRSKNTLATRVQSRIKQLAKQEQLQKLDRIHTLEFSFNSSPFPAKIMLSVDNLAFGYTPDQQLISGLKFEIQAHDRICVIGQNGKGKSTLLRLLAGELSPSEGNVQAHPRLTMGYFAQTNVDTLSPGNTVVDEIMSSDSGCLPQTARNIAGAMMFEGDNALKKVSILSGGEKSRVMLGKLIVAPCHMLLLDEPTNHLDMDSCDSLLAAIDDFAGAAVMVTHNEMFLRTIANRFIIFDRGRVMVFDGSYDDFLNKYGWELDETEGNVRREVPKPQTLDKKALRRARAVILQEKSKTLSPLNKRVAKLEDRIPRLEEEQQAALAQLEKASVSGDGEKIARLSQRNTELSAAIDAAYGELDNATRELEAASAEFDARLEQLD